MMRPDIILLAASASRRLRFSAARHGRRDAVLPTMLPPLLDILIIISRLFTIAFYCTRVSGERRAILEFKRRLFLLMPLP